MPISSADAWIVYSCKKASSPRAGQQNLSRLTGHPPDERLFAARLTQGTGISKLEPHRK